MLAHPTQERLIALGLTGMAKALDDQRRSPDIAALGFEERLGLLVDHEAAERENRRMTTRLKFAALRHDASIEDVDLRTPRGLDRALFQRLAAGSWLDRHEGVGVVLEHRSDGRGRVEGLLVDDLHGRVAEDHGSVRRDHPEPVLLVAGQAEEVGDAGHPVRRATARRHDVGAGVERTVHGVVHRLGDGLVVLGLPVDPLEQGAVDVQRDDLGTPAGRGVS